MKNQTSKLPKNLRRLMIFNAKGGVGKTAVALNLALTFGYGIITNDRLSLIESVLGKDRSRILEENEPLPDIPTDWPIIFDFGGYPDKRALTALTASRAILIPILPYKENIQSSLDFIKEIKDFSGDKREIIIILNQTVANQYQVFSRLFNGVFKDIKTFNIKRSSAFSWMISQKKSISDLARDNKLQRRHFEPVAEQFNQIADHLRSVFDPHQTNF